MKIEFTDLFLKNYQSWKALEFEIIPGRHFIMGKNGHGKSTIMESLVWSLFKTTTRGKDPSMNRNGNCITGFGFKIGEDSYTVTRYHKHKTKGNGLQITMNGEDISHRLTESVEGELEKLIPIPYDLFVCTSVVLQGLPVNFTQFTPTTRKQIFEDALGFSVWKDLRKKFTRKMDEVGAQAKEVEGKIADLDKQITYLTSRIETIEEKNNERSTGDKTKLKNLKDALASITIEIENLKEERKKVLNGKQEAHLREEEEGYDAQIKEFENQIKNVKTIIEEKECPTCGTKYPESKMKEAEKKLKTIEKMLKVVETAIEPITKAIEIIDDFCLRSSDLKKDYENKNRELAGIIAEIKESKTDNSKEIVELKEKLQGLLDTVNGFNEEFALYNNKLREVREIDNLLLPSSKFRTAVLEKYLTHITKIIDSVAPMVFKGIDIILAPTAKGDGIDINLVKDGIIYDYKMLSGGQKKRLDIIIILAFQKFLIETSGVSTNLVVLDEIMDTLDSEGVDSILQCMESLFPEDTAVYVMSHNANIKSHFNSVIRVEYENGTSSLG